MIDRDHCITHSLAVNENNDCTVRACAVALQVDYLGMREFLNEHYGRKPGRGMSPASYHAALQELGATLTKLRGPRFEYRETYVEASDDGWTWRPGHYRTTRRKAALRGDEDYTSTTVVALARELTRGTYLVGTSGHVLCLRDGEVHDFTAGKRHRVLDVFKVTV